MTGFLYFAYGSNMLTERLVARCASARTIGPAAAAGHGLAFGKRSKDGSGKAMLVAGEPPEGRVHGVLFEIAAAERAALDGFEGVGYGYRREDAFPVQRTDTGESVAAAVYLAESGHVDATLQPYEWYRALVLAGAHQHRLPPAWIARLEGCAFRVDPDPDRPSRCEALALLAGVGFAHLLPGGLPG